MQLSSVFIPDFQVLLVEFQKYKMLTKLNSNKRHLKDCFGEAKELL